MTLILKKIICYISFLCLFCFIGPAFAENAIFQDNAYIKEDNNKLNCELNGAWSTEYKYSWLADPLNNNKNLPDFIKDVSYFGVIQEVNSIGLSTPENLTLKEKRNKYHLTSSLTGETIEVSFNLENKSDYTTWVPFSFYFNPFDVEDFKQQVRVKLSYANNSLGDIGYIQNLDFNSGCYLNLKVKLPPRLESGKLTIQIKPNASTKATLSGIFWSNERENSTVDIKYSGQKQISAQKFYESKNISERSLIWSPKKENEILNGAVNITLGEVTYTTSTGFEFPGDLKRKNYNFQVLKGKKGKKGFNGLELYLKPETTLCTNGCELGLYFTEKYKQDVFIYSAFNDKTNKLLAKVETNGNGSASFENFQISSTAEIPIRIRLTTNDKEIAPVLRGLYILQNELSSDPVLTTDSTPKPTSTPVIVPVETPKPVEIPIPNVISVPVERPTPNSSTTPVPAETPEPTPTPVPTQVETHPSPTPSPEPTSTPSVTPSATPTPSEPPSNKEKEDNIEHNEKPVESTTSATPREENNKSTDQESMEISIVDEDTEEIEKQDKKEEHKAEQKEDKKDEQKAEQKEDKKDEHKTEQKEEEHKAEQKEDKKDEHKAEQKEERKGSKEVGKEGNKKEDKEK